MRKVIRQKEYNTENATVLGTYTQGQFGDPNGYQEKLMQTPDGYLFMYGCGGPSSPYPVETIKAVSKVSADKWLNRIG